MVGRQAEMALFERKIDQVLEGGASGGRDHGGSRWANPAWWPEVLHLAGLVGFDGFIGECESYGANTSHLVWQNLCGFFGLTRPGGWMSRQALDDELVPFPGWRRFCRCWSLRSTCPSWTTT
jgi:hypothetical protein